MFNALRAPWHWSRQQAWGLALVICILGIGILQYQPAFSPHDKALVQAIQGHIHHQEANVSSALLDRHFFRELLEVINGRQVVTNELIEKMRNLAQKPYALFLYKNDSLIFWSKPGPVIDASLIGKNMTPVVASDHYEDFLIKEYALYHQLTSYKAYAKIPILPSDANRPAIRVFPLDTLTGTGVHTTPGDRDIIRTEEGVAVCAIQPMKPKLSFWHQVALLFFFAMGLLAILILGNEMIRSLYPRFAIYGGRWTQAAFILGVRGLSFFTGYHEVLDRLALFTPFTYLGNIPYSRADLVIDSILFLWIALIAARTPMFPLREKTTRLEKGAVSVGTYLVLILIMGLAAWLHKTLITSQALPLYLEEISFLHSSTAAVFTAMGLTMFGLFVIAHCLLRSVQQVEPSIYRRIGAMLAAAVISLGMIHMLQLNLPFFGFYLAILSLILLFDLFSEIRSPSVIWVVSWALLISGFEASMLYKYQDDKDHRDRQELAERIAVSINSQESLEEQLIQWLPGIPPQYSLAIFEGQTLGYSYNHDYPLIMTEYSAARIPDDVIYTAGRSDVGARHHDIVVLIGKQDHGLIGVVSLFSYVFTIFSILLFVLAMGNSVIPFLPEPLNLSFSSRPTLRNRIQVAIVFLIILAFVIIGFVTVFYLRNSTEDRDKRYFEDRLRAVASSMSQAIPATDTLDGPQTLIPKIAGIAYVYNRQAKIYDAQGDLVLQSDGHEQAESRPAVKMSFLSKFIMDQSNRSYTVEDRGDTGRGIIALRDRSGTRFGYVEMPGTAMVQSDPGSRFFGTLLNAYVFLFLIAVALAIAVANSITRPLAELSDKLKALAIGKKNEPIQWGINDEIGALINDYNGMIDKLDESAQILALTERDLAWREMARQVAHEIKNPLTPMKLSIQYLQSGVHTSPEMLSQLVQRVSNTLIEQIDNLSTIASEFSNFAKMPQAENEKVLLNDVVASVHDLFRKREDMDIHLSVPIQDIYVFADRNQLVRVLNNVVKNAIQAVPDDRRGRIDIALKKQEDKALISIADNGVGIPPEMKDKVFSPNFTTKSSGTGLGLAICANIVETFNGKIHFETKEGKGSTFYIEIPLMKLEDNLREEKRVTL